MAGLEWGPIAQLATCLHLHTRDAPLAWLNRLAQAGSAWRHAECILESTFWPPNLPEFVSDARGTLRRVWPRLHVPPARRVDSQAIARLLPVCHAWQATENTRFVAPFLTIDPFACPTWTGHTSDRALVWSLIVFAAERHGPKAVLSRPALMHMVFIDQKTPPGDLLVFHRDVERLAKCWWENFGKDVRAQEPARAGGLRTRSFPDAIAGLPIAHRNAILLLASRSPLTRLAYLELFPDTPGAEELSVLPRIMEAEPQDFGLWRALIANTLLGALLATAPVLAEFKRAEIDLRELQYQARNRRFSNRLSGQRRLARAQSRFDGVRERVFSALLARLEAWRAITQASDALELHVTVLDRLARLAAVRATSAMRDEWQRVRMTDPAARARVALFQPRSAYYAELIALLLGMTLDGFHSLLPQPQQGRIGTLLGSVLDVGSPDGAPGPCARFWHEDFGIRLPFRPINDRGDCPARVFEYLLQWLPSMFPIPNEPVEVSA
jgi:hypothetical protein